MAVRPSERDIANLIAAMLKTRRVGQAVADRLEGVEAASVERGTLSDLRGMTHMAEHSDVSGSLRRKGWPAGGPQRLI